MARYGMIIDLDHCIGCYCCQIACKDEHVGNEFPPYMKPQPAFGQFWIGIKEVEQVLSPDHVKVTYIPTLSQSQAILKAAKDGAVYQRPDHIVLIDPAKSRGQQQLVAACPTGAVFWNQEEGIPQKCTFCAHLLDDGWKTTRCSQACPTDCIMFGDLDNPESTISKFLAAHRDEVEVLHPDEEGPNVLYVGLPKPFVTGTLISKETDDCLGGVKVTLTGPGGGAQEGLTDCFGFFRFKTKAKGKHTIAIEAPGYPRQIHEVEVLDTTVWLGELGLSPSRT